MSAEKVARNAEIVRLYTETDMSMQEVARAVGLAHHERVRGLLQKAGVPSKGRGRFGRLNSRNNHSRGTA